MEQQTLELLRALQSSERDQATFTHIRGLLPQERTRLAAADDRATLADISELLEVWADSAPRPLAGIAALEAAQIAEEDLEQAERAAQLYLLSLERSADISEPLRRLDQLLSRRGQQERLETMLVAQVATMAQDGQAEPSGAAAMYRRIGQLRASRDGASDSAIDAYERALDLAVDTDIIRELAELYGRRGGSGDAAQAADLYCMLAEVVPAEQSVAMLERALEQLPSHDAALDLLETSVPAGEQAQHVLKPRWAAYIERSDNEQGVDKRRLLLARAYAADDQQRDALICLGPLIEKSDPEALSMQAALLSALQEHDQRTAASQLGASSGNGKIVRPPTLVGFRTPAPGEAQAAQAEGVALEPAAVASPPAATAKSTPTALNKPALGSSKSQPALQAKPSAKPATGAAVKPALASKPAIVSTKPAPAASKPALASKPAIVSTKPAIGSAKPASPAPAKPAAAAPNTTSAASTAQAKAATAPAQNGPSAPQSKPATERTSAAVGNDSDPAPVPGGGASFSGAAVQQTEVKPIKAKPARSGATLVGFRLPDADGKSSASEAALPAAEQFASAKDRIVAEALRRAAAADAALAGGANTPASSARPSSQPPPLASAAAKAAALRASRASTADASVSNAPPQRASSASGTAPALRGRASTSGTAPALQRVASSAPSAASPDAAPMISHAQAAPAASLLGDDFPGSKRFDPTADKRWLYGGSAAIVVFAVGLLLVLRSGPKPATPSITSTRGEAVAPQAPAQALEPPPAAPVAPPQAAALPVAVPAAAPQEHPEPAATKPKKAPTPRLVPGKAHVSGGGGLSSQQVALVLEDALPNIERCYGDALDKKPKLKGRVVFGFTIEKNGHPAKVRTLSGSLKDEAVEQCSADAIQKVRFPKSKKHASEITWPLEYKRS